ncbi:ubiquitin-like protein UBact [Candidatus Nitronereus thalassa]|uniref:Prokaryotic ubiquitin-like protein UBact n=1 Tax=Candidatus Nitronereus thalassa TaxID=3020898 RepID=A0ABU3K3Z5_9BACT|nr:ubiquitin-like protein UBact [Candidatus Nitronereus thalassa]MDT7041110.1 ubiquitin-like protein UBact [Candidatus Nitronereus thalassa]
MKSQNQFYMIGSTPTNQPTTLERRERPLDPIPKPPGPKKDDDAGPRQPEPGSPSRDNLIKRMRKVDPKQAERYRQRTGE